MIRNLKVLLAAAMALAAVGVFSASAAQAHTPGQFSCTAPCAATIETDGASTSATGHHVFVIKNSLGETVSITGAQLTGYATAATSPTQTLEFTNLAYHHVTANGQPATVDMNGCKYDINTIVSAQPNVHDLGSVTIQGCNAGKGIEITLTGTTCVVTVGPQGPLPGLTFHNDGTRVTATAKVPGIAVTLDEGGVEGSCLIKKTTGITSEYTTGNVLVQGYNDPAGTPADQHGGTKVNVSFSPTVT